MCIKGSSGGKGGDKKVTGGVDKTDLNLGAVLYISILGASVFIVIMSL